VVPPQPHWSTSLTAHKPGIIPLRPLGFGDILEGSFAAVRRNPRTVLGLALLTLLVVVGSLAVVGALGYLAVTSLPTGGASDTLLAVGTVGGLTLVWLLSAITSVALTGMLSYPVGESVLGRKPTLRETWRHTRRMLPRLAGLCLVLLVPAVVVFGGLVALIVWAFTSNSPLGGTLGFILLLGGLVASIWVAIRVSLATPALVLEDIGVFAALRRSWRLTLGRFWRVLGLLLVANIIVAIVQQVLSTGFQLAGMAIGFGLASTMSGSAAEAVMAISSIGATILGVLLSSLVAQPFIAAVTALIYTDARIRSEGFDLALVRAATGAAASRVAG
jgi:membrane-anchored glycerophosphoryl diester phosphodiesterase (GDPDase)